MGAKTPWLTFLYDINSRLTGTMGAQETEYSFCFLTWR
jgi:hypothetical protein